ncbi:polyketide synthase dehydratase domain-containing protein, partial [Saccharomonospora iraqiensis]|uniref:polyketide synthase dehydratase domain-containing protein n=1 Tax=Saccharomonospora iraqiensis TaxID=52698 RepID=UPI00022DED92
VEPDAVTTALARLHAAGRAPAPVPPGAGRADIPTYPFRRDSFWLTAPVGKPGAHPVLTDEVTLAGTGDLVLSGTVDTATHSWLAGHVVDGQVLLPGTALLDLAAHAATRAGDLGVVELTLTAPVVVPDGESVDVQVLVDTGRALTIHARRAGGTWEVAATGRVGEVVPETRPRPDGTPAPLDPDALYDRFARNGLDYGPAFRGLTGLWRHDTTYTAEITAPGGLGGGYAVHPALLDTALHAVGLGELDGDTGTALLPFSFTGATVTGPVTGSLRATLTPIAPLTVAVEVVDDTGRVVAAIAALALRPARAADPASDLLYRVEWTRIDLPATEVPTDRFLVHNGHDVAETLVRIRQFLAMPDEKTFVVVTDGGLDSAGIIGLIRSARAEHPGRIVLIEAAGTPDTADLAAALATGEPEIALRGGVASVPRLVRVPSAERGGDAPVLDPDGTVLITGGTGSPGSL